MIGFCIKQLPMKFLWVAALTWSILTKAGGHQEEQQQHLVPF